MTAHQGFTVVRDTLTAMYRTFLALLFVGGLFGAVFGTLLPGGGGSTLAVLGCTLIGAGLVLVGLSLKSDRDSAS